MAVTSEDLKLMLESVNRQLHLNNHTVQLRLEITRSRKVSLYQVKTINSDRDISAIAEGEETYNVLVGLQRLLQFTS